MRAHAALALALLASGCASQQGLSARGTPAGPAGLQAAHSLEHVRVAPEAAPGEMWWEAYGDPQLDALIAEALRGSPSLRLAQARVDRAHALAEAAGAPREFQLSVAADASRQRLSEHGLIPPGLGGQWIWQNQALLNFSYEFDFWNRNGAAYAAALGQARAAMADAEAARLVLAAAVAQAYVQLARAFDQLELARESLAQRERQLALTQERVSAGLDSRVELKLAEAGVPEARQRIVRSEEAIALARNQIAALLGAGPDRGLALVRPGLASHAAAVLPSRLPADLLGRRPDVAASRWRVEAAARAADSARAEFYPNINLVAFAGLQAITWSHLLEFGSRTLGAGPALRLPLFDGSRLRGNLGAKNADYDAAVEQYNQTLADALREVADQIAAFRSIDRQDAEVAAAVAAAQESYDLALARYGAGLANYLTVLAAQSQLTVQRGLAAELRARRLEAAIALARALGGGYTEKG